MAECNATRACQACGGDFEPAKGRGRPRKYCERCAPASERAAPPLPQRGVWDIGICVSGGLRACAVCSRAFWGMHGGQAVCSAECGKERQRSNAVASQTRRAKPKPAAVHCDNPRCGAEFNPAYGDRRTRYCSSECRRQHKWQLTPDSCHRRRARRYGVTYEAVDPIKVFERDLWTCQICLRQLSPADRGSHKATAPELDHVVPLSAGGAHTWANVQCACRGCNLQKGAKVLPLAA